MPTHFKGPIIGSHQAAGGALQGAPIELVNRVNYGFWFDDFVGHTAEQTDYARWSQANIGSPTSPALQQDPPTVTTENQSMGCLEANPGSVDSTGSGWVLRGVGNVAAISLLDNVEFWFVSRILTPDITAIAAFVGMTDDDETALTTAGAMDITDGIGFHMADGGAVTGVSERSDGAAALVTATSTAMTDDVWLDVAFRGVTRDITSDTGNGFVQFWTRVGAGGWVNLGVLENGIPEATGDVVSGDNLIPTIAVVNAGGTGTNFYLDYMGFAVKRANY